LSRKGNGHLDGSRFSYRAPRDQQRTPFSHRLLCKRPGISTTGLLLLNLTQRDFQALDRYEEIPQLYTREKVEVFDQRGNPVRCGSISRPHWLSLAKNKAMRL
jgi:hypothetical protein